MDGNETPQLILSYGSEIVEGPRNRGWTGASYRRTTEQRIGRKSAEQMKTCTDRHDGVSSDANNAVPSTLHRSASWSPSPFGQTLSRIVVGCRTLDCLLSILIAFK